MLPGGSETGQKGGQCMVVARAILKDYNNCGSRFEHNTNLTFSRGGNVLAVAPRRAWDA